MPEPGKMIRETELNSIQNVHPVVTSHSEQCTLQLRLPAEVPWAAEAAADAVEAEAASVHTLPAYGPPRASALGEWGGAGPIPPAVGWIAFGRSGQVQVEPPCVSLYLGTPSRGFAYAVQVSFCRRGLRL